MERMVKLAGQDLPERKSMKQDKLAWARLVGEAEAKQLPLIEYLLERSAAQLETDKASVLARMESMLQVMEEAVAFGMTGVRSNSGLTGGSAKMWSAERSNPSSALELETGMGRTGFRVLSPQELDEAAEAFIRKLRSEGYKGVGMLHMFLACYCRTIAKYPALNRFIAGQRIYARNRIEVVMTIKKKMTIEGGETAILF